MATLINIATNLGSLDLYQNAEDVFYVTRQINDLRSFQTRNADFTKSLGLPPTSKNIQILSSFKQGTTEDDQSIPCSISMGGVMIAPTALLYNTSTTVVNDASELTVVILYGNFNFFEAIKVGTIDEINWADLALTWDDVTLVPQSENTTDLVFPICDWFTRDTNHFMNFIVTDPRNSMDCNPAGFFIYAKEIITRIANEADFDIIFDSSIPNDFNLIALACPVDKFVEFQDIDQIPIAAEVENSIDQVSIGTTDRAIFQTVISDPGANWNAGSNQYESSETIEIEITVDGDFSYNRGHPNNIPSRIVIFRNATEIAEFSFDQTAGSTPFFMSVTEIFVNNDILFVEIEAANNQALATVTLEAGTRFKIVNPGSDVSRTIQPSQYIPQINRNDFLVDMLKLFNLLIVTDAILNEVTIYGFDKVFSSAEQNLSNRIDVGKDSPIEILPSLASIGQRSLFEWQSDNLFRRDAKFTKRFFNQILSNEVTVLTMDYSACDNSLLLFNATNDTFLKAKIPFISVEVIDLVVANLTISIDATGAFEISSPLPNWNIGDFFFIWQAGINEGWWRVTGHSSDTAGTFNYAGPVITAYDMLIQKRVGPNNFENRLALIRSDGGEDTFTLYEGAPVNNTPFTSNSLTANWLDSLKMSEIVNTHYKNLFEALEFPQLVRAWFNISAAEFVALDFQRPIYLSNFNAFYYLNKIEQFKIGSKTRIELVRISTIN